MGGMLIAYSPLQYNYRRMLSVVAGKEFYFLRLSTNTLNSLTTANRIANFFTYLKVRFVTFNGLREIIEFVFVTG